MGLLDDVIGAALGGQNTRSAQGQSAFGQGPSSAIAAALMALLASRLGGGASGQQSTSGGLEGLVNQFKQGGFEDIINSWIGTGQNQPISPSQLRQALGPEQVNDLSDETGMPQDDLLSQLSRILPGVVDKLTPNGQLPNEGELLPGPRGV